MALSSALLGLLAVGTVGGPQYSSAGEAFRFAENLGQWGKVAKFHAQSPGLDVWLTSTSIVYDLHRQVHEVGAGPLPAAMGQTRQDSQPNVRVGQVIQVDFVGASGHATPQGIDPKQIRESYFVGDDATKWAKNVRSYGAAKLRNLYPGIDLVGYFDSATNAPRYDLLLKPGANPNVIRMRYSGAGNLRATPKGDLAIDTRFGTIKEQNLVAYDVASDGTRIPIRAARKIDSNGDVRFDFVGHDATKSLVIDPMIYTNYIGGADEDYVLAITKGADQSCYVGGYTATYSFPTTPGAYRTVIAGLYDAFVQKVDNTGNPVWCSFFGGRSDEAIRGIAYDAARDSVVAVGSSESTNLPITPGAYQRQLKSSVDACLFTLSGDGTALRGCTLLGGANEDWAVGVTLDPASGDAFLTGVTGSRKFPTTAGSAQRVHGGGDYDAYVARMAVNGTNLFWSTYLGGSDDEFGYGATVTPSGNVVVCGNTLSTNFPTSAGAFQTAFQGAGTVYGDGYVTALSATTGSGIWSTYLGGSDDDTLESVAADATGNIYVAGGSTSLNFPTTAGAARASFAGGSTEFGYYTGDAVIAKLNPTGTSEVFGTFLGGTGSELIHGIAVDSAGYAYVTGDTLSGPLPVTPGAFQPVGLGSFDSFVARLQPNGKAFAYLSFLSGSADEAAMGIAVDATGGKTYVGGWTTSPDLPVWPAGAGTFALGSADGFAAKFDMKASVTPVVLRDLLAVPSIQGGDVLIVDVYLSSAPATNQTVNITSNLNATIPAFNVVVPAGSNHIRGYANTNPIATGTAKSVILKATLGASSRNAPVQVHPAFTLSIIPGSVTGGSTAMGMISLYRPAGADLTFSATSTSAFAAPDAGPTILNGQAVGTFAISTLTTRTTRTAIIKVAGFGTQQSIPLTITP